MTSGMVSFVRQGRPPTANKNIRGSGQRAQQEMQELYKAAGGSLSIEHRYGIVYYFVRGYRPTNDADADNVSKRVWDALEGAAYPDDHVVRLRVAGVIEAGPAGDGAPALEELDLSDMPPGAARELISLWREGSGTSFTLNLAAFARPCSPSILWRRRVFDEDRAAHRRAPLGGSRRRAGGRATARGWL